MLRLVSLLLLLAAGCAAAAPEAGATTTDVPVTPSGSSAAGSGCADVVAVEAVEEPGGTFRFEVTVASSDTGWDRYADRWEVRDPAGAVLATRLLAHPHVDEQPFTRSVSGVSVPPGVLEVQVAAHDSVAGWCGRTVTSTLPAR